ncbi:uncharacterized protein A4U43_C01F34740 [Asparagus officinalis]|uniref:C3H1-type domain-containing protein n=1 Tax=Asparagus officinalis TaxID=4686 RepID=A0A5P1FUG9_ASPOF|nr:uncharacterized protein A4U43_C01F34740 [Asparagus officinalis]
MVSALVRQRKNASCSYSYFLQGLCTNISCSYQHVYVNPKASVCDGFLRGYCADDDECRKKHGYVCPLFEATGIRPQGSKCKLHHPKSRKKSKKRKHSEIQNSSRRRYFSSKIVKFSKLPHESSKVLTPLKSKPKNDTQVQQELSRSTINPQKFSTIYKSKKEKFSHHKFNQISNFPKFEELGLPSLSQSLKN